ncbi:PadR family transcriptional regulator [uncultured Enterococcus sp.]|uniref:PadR family transcriptional regulator n=1 Tax=uncultured Enterococcus sp. TaxID=167972 RepID=UPI002AA78106|nr:PadR family transcriptional regulator [uncultured Enterococcus sp.]
MKETQLLKGVLDGCVLKVIGKREIYGYELVQYLKENGFPTIVGGTVYPLLQKLEKQGLILSRLKPSKEGPDRKYFSLTKDGSIYLEEFTVQWYGLIEKVQHILEEE